MSDVRLKRSTLLLLFASLAVSVVGGCSSVAPVRSLATTSAEVQIPPKQFLHSIDNAVKRVTEFREIAQWGKEQGLRIWIAGGTATGLATYESQRLEHEALKARGLPSPYHAGRFSDAYFDIYRSTQDADVVIDGSETDALKLEKFLRERFGALQASKEIWEVRLLNSSRGEGAGKKDPLLGFDFLNQNSDSFSTGMIELTDPARGESRVRDLFDWKNAENPRYLQDILERKVSFYRNPKHFETGRAKEGLNPEILSAIRVLTKALQYEAEIRSECLADLRTIIHSFDPNSNVTNYVINQVSKNGQKLFWHSPNVERAWDLVEKLGLRKKLIEFGLRHDTRDLALWLDKEPLRTHALGAPSAKHKTAKELGIDFVAHETKSFIAFENISRSLSGKPNVFISRPDTSGESAAYGPGFYTKVGREGAVGSGLTIRFRVDPDAVEGIDFIYEPSAQFVIFRNAKALRVIDESLALSLPDYFRLLAQGDFTESDRGLLEKLKLKVSVDLTRASSLERRKIVKILEKALDRDKAAGKGELSPALKEWFSSSMARLEPELLDRVVRELPLKPYLFWTIPELANSVAFPDRMDAGLKSGSEKPGFVQILFSLESLQKHPRYKEWMDHVLKNSPYLFSLKLSRKIENHPHVKVWLEAVMENLEEMRKRAVTEGPVTASHLLEVENAAVKVLGFPVMFDHPKFSSWMDQFLAFKPLPSNNSSATPANDLVDRVMNQEWVVSHPKYDQWMKILIEKAPGKVAHDLLNKEVVSKHPSFSSWVYAILRLEGYAPAHWYLRSPWLFTHPDYAGWIELALSLPRPERDALVLTVFSNPALYAHPDFEKWMIAGIELSMRYSHEALFNPAFIGHPAFLRVWSAYDRRAHTPEGRVMHAHYDAEWTQDATALLDNPIFLKAHGKELQALTGMKKPDIETLRSAFRDESIACKATLSSSK